MTFLVRCPRRMVAGCCIWGRGADLATKIVSKNAKLDRSADEPHAANARREYGRLMLAFAITPLVPAFYGAFFFAQPWDIAVLMPYAYLAELFVGLPLALWYRHRRQRGPLYYGLGGFICSLPLLLTYEWIGVPPHFAPFDWIAASTVGGGGVVTGFAFWLLAVAGESPIRWRDLIDPHP